MKKLSLLALLLLSFGAITTAKAQKANATSDEILRIEESRFTAMTRGDIAELSKILADDLVYAHSSGRVDGKKEFLASLESGNLKYVSIQNDEQKARLYGGVALVNGRARVTITSQGQEQSFVLRYLDVYVKRNNKWQMVAWQSTRLP
jgi:ketosteroid isomerase-like protein